jgi:hypothetical protein
MFRSTALVLRCRLAPAITIRLFPVKSLAPPTITKNTLEGGKPVAWGGEELLHGLPVRREVGRKDPPIPVAHS